MRELQERYKEKKKKLYHVFVDLESAFDRVPREVIEERRRKGLEELVRKARLKVVWICEAKRRTHPETSNELRGREQKTTRKAEENVEKGGGGRYEDAEHHRRDGYGQATYFFRPAPSLGIKGR